MEAAKAVKTCKTMKKRTRLSRLVLNRRLIRFQKQLAQNTNEFCRNTTLHGLRYFTDADLFPLEKLFFVASFVSVVLLSGFFVLQVFDKWNTTPVILSISPEPTYITREAFPAVTVCNLNQAYKSRANQYSVFSVEFAMLQMLCKREVNVTIADTITDWSNLKQFIIDNSQPCSNMLLSCRFGAITYNCTDLFNQIVTDEGVCCVFNMVHPDFLYKPQIPRDGNVSAPEGFEAINWSSENGYPSKLPKRFYPRTSVGTGVSLGLTITVDVEADTYYCSSLNSIGFKILLHNPTELPSLREVGLLLSAGQETTVRIAAEKVEAEQSVRSVKKKYRQCLFQNEMKLTIFSHYTQRSCLLECLANALLTRCGCISHFMPRLYGNEPICSIYESSCVEHVRLSAMVMGEDDVDCHSLCLPSCFDLNFEPNFFSTPLSHSGFQIANEVVKNLSSAYVEQNVAVVHIYFKENTYRSIKQTEFFDITDFLSSVGGLIGLFFGFSFISLSEFIYYAIIRPCRTAQPAKPASKKALANGFQFKSDRFRGNHGHSEAFPKRAAFTNKRSYVDAKHISGEFIKSISESVAKYRSKFTKTNSMKNILEQQNEHNQNSKHVFPYLE